MGGGEIQEVRDWGDTMYVDIWLAKVSQGGETITSGAKAPCPPPPPPSPKCIPDNGVVREVEPMRLVECTNSCPATRD